MAETAKNVEEKKEMSKRNWADDDEDVEGDDDVEIGGSTVAQVGQPSAPMVTLESAGKTVMPQKPRVHRERNIHGDFVVTKINIKEREIPVPEKNSDDEESEEEESSEEEEEPQREEPEEEVKKGK